MRLVEKLRALGKKVDIISKTHTASARAGGVTADHYVRRYVLHGLCVADVIWVDELFQLETALWAQLQKLKGRQWILSGDQFQFPALFDQWKGTAVNEGALLNSRMLWELTGNRLSLTACMRSERQLFDFFSSLIPGGSRYELPMPEVLAQAKAAFSFEGPARHNLCISHRKRIRLNAEINKLFLPETGWKHLKAKPARGQLCAAQSMFIWPGIELLGCSRSGRKIRNNVVYTVESLEDDHALLRAETGDQFTLSYEAVADLLRLSFARTYASIQGTEFESGRVRLHDTANKHFSKRHLFVAISRCRRAEDIDIAP